MLKASVYLLKALIYLLKALIYLLKAFIDLLKAFVGLIQQQFEAPIHFRKTLPRELNMVGKALFDSNDAFKQLIFGCVG